MSALEASMKTMKENTMVFLAWPGAANSARDRKISLSRLAVRRLAVFAALLQCLGAAQAGDVSPAGETDSQPTRAQNPASPVPGRQMERYKAFARQADLPLITVTTNNLIEVGGVVKTDVARLAQLSIQEKAALAEQFSVPVGVIDKLVERVVSNAPPAADEFAQELRTAVIDYRFLQIEWDRYHPPTEGRQTKAAALGALQVGDLSKAWALYDGLARPEAPAIGRPAPPTNLRVVSGP
jgi:hypothetical protein